MMRASYSLMVLPVLIAMTANVPATHAQDRDSNAGFQRAIDSVMPRVVKLYGLGAGKQKGYGTGIIVSDDGDVLTVFSLLIDARHIRAVLADGTIHQAEVIHRDRQRQLALLRLTRPTAPGTSPAPNALDPFPSFDLDRDVNAAVGDWVLAAGNAFKVADGAEPVSIAHGIISTRTRLDARRRLKDFPYRGDVLIFDGITSNPGAPGSAVVNLDGELVGMIGRVVTSNQTYTHLNYALPRDVLDEFYLESLAAEQGEPTPPETTDQSETPLDPGIRLSRVGYQRILPFVERVKFGSPAQRAGVRKDDLILSLNGRNIPDADEYKRRLSYLEPGESIDLVVQRGRAIVSLRIEMDEK